MNPQKTSLKVNGVYRDNARSYYTVKYKQEEYRVPLFPFQIEQNIKPEELDCIIRDEDGSIRITQDFATVINHLYKEGETYIVKVRQKELRYYKVEDPNGLIFFLNDPQKDLHPGQLIKAKVESIEQNRVMMTWVGKKEEDPLVPFRNIDTLRNDLNLDEEAADNLRALLQHKTFAHAQTLYNEKNSLWLLEITVCLDEILLGNGEKEVNATHYIDLFQKLCIYILEESNILRQMSTDERKAWITKISAIAQHADDYKEAYRIMADNGSREYIERQLKNLQESENLYQPERKFRIIMCIFNLHEDIMNEMMPKIFTIISGGNKEHWKAEPFRKAFVDMLELFITEYRERAVQRTGTDIIHKMITAIAIQQLLSTGEDDIDRRLNQATYYRLLAYVNNTASEAILNEAFHSLFGQYNEELEYTWSDVNDPVSLYFCYSYKKKSQKPRGTLDIQRQVYYGDRLEFLVDGKTLLLQPTSGGTDPIDLKDLVNWRGFELRANAPVKSKAKEKEKVKPLTHYWENITEALLAKPHAKPKIKQTPSVGDRVWIKVINDDEEFESLECEIVDNILEGKGWLDLDQVVKYIRPNKEDGNAPSFQDEDGNPLLFKVEVTANADKNGYMLFSMLPVINEYFKRKYSIGDIVRCNVRAQSEYGYLCVSEDGASCLVSSPEHPLQKDYVVNAVLDSFNYYGQLCCEFDSHSSETFSIGHAYKNLLQTLGVAPTEDTKTEEEQIIEDSISPIAMKEVIGILDRLSALNEKKTESYSLLSVAQLLAQMLNDPQTSAYYEKRKSLILALEEYEQNGYVDENRLARLIDTMGKDLITTDYLVNETISKFKILDALKHKDRVNTLFEIRKQTANPKIRDAADLAIAILLTDRFEIANVSRLLHDRINRELEIAVRTSTMRDFGIETQEKEFKSSVIYPADNRMQPAPQRQRAVIMQTICGFLNSDKGGTLYIGVNKEGGACGVENDLKHLQTDEDGYGRYIHGMINEDMGQIANQCCTDCEWIEESGYKIYVMKIKPSPDLTAIGDEYWIRQDTEKRPLKPENVEQFRKMHQEAYRKYHAE